MNEHHAKERAENAQDNQDVAQQQNRAGQLQFPLEASNQGRPMEPPTFVGVADSNHGFNLNNIPRMDYRTLTDLEPSIEEWEEYWTVADMPKADRNGNAAPMTGAHHTDAAIEGLEHLMPDNLDSQTIDEEASRLVDEATESLFDGFDEFVRNP